MLGLGCWEWQALTLHRGRISAMYFKYLFYLILFNIFTLKGSSGPCLSALAEDGQRTRWVSELERAGASKVATSTGPRVIAQP